MSTIEIELTLNKYSIETEAKRMYNKLLSRYFSKSISTQDKSIVEHSIKGIKFFLEHADFSRLRSAYPELEGRKDTRVILKIVDNLCDLKIISNGMTIDPEWND